MLPQCALGASHLGPPSPGALPGRAGAGRQRPPVLKGAGPWRAARPLPCAEAAARTRQEASAPLACSGDLGSPRTRRAQGAVAKSCQPRCVASRCGGHSPPPGPPCRSHPESPWPGSPAGRGSLSPQPSLAAAPHFSVLTVPALESRCVARQAAKAPLVPVLSCLPARAGPQRGWKRRRPPPHALGTLPLFCAERPAGSPQGLCPMTEPTPRPPGPDT